MVPGDSLEPPESEKIGMHGAAVTKSPPAAVAAN